jgi:hypothetical protein
MSIEKRPYAGTWRLNQKKLVQHSPDGLVFINGDVSIPGCKTCNQRINLRHFITAISCDAGVTTQAGSASFTLSIPRAGNENFIEDSHFILRRGLEVHIYLKGYFPVKGLYRGLGSELEQAGLSKLGLEDILNYPYYPTFHGVITEVSPSYSGGFYTATVNCATMLHFWAYHNMSTNASFFGARPANSKLRMSLTGNNFNKMNPYEIMYTLYHDTAGAAGGVAFALGSKTNQTATSEVFNKSFFSLNIQYWQKRFSQRMMNLRMYGVDGSLLSSVQAAFLARLSSRQSNELLAKSFPSKKRTKRFEIMSTAAKALGLQNDKIRERLLFASKGSGSKKQRFDLNLLQMQAFVQDLSSFGQLNLFESTSQSKMDIANQVVQLTGFELYQDVDGDIVFKPPSYNLDTSSSRVYTIEAIDIISLSYSEKEPEATYVTVKGSHIRNFRGTGLSNEWGVRGQYIDYRKVAQFGWRPLSLELSYVTSPKTLFFIGVNRLTLANIAVNSANLSIPIRPEMRPGYPVYIKPIDCFYYVTNISHALNYGSQSTSTLSLVAKRAKFFAPGDPDKTGIGSIDLSNTVLPAKPLSVVEDGRVKKKGFPNVVMALDPTEINPLYFLVGGDIEDISNPQVLSNLVNKAVNYNIVAKEKDANGQVYYSFFSGDTKKYVFTMDGRQLQNTKGQIRVDLVSAAKQKEQTRKASINQPSLQKKLRYLEGSRRLKNRLLTKGKIKDAKRLAQIQAEVKKLDAQIKNYRARLSRGNSLINGKSEAVKVLDEIISLLGTAYSKASRSYKDVNSTANLLDALSDKKASFTNGQLPGSYRYYSSSHPDPKQQGFGLSFDDTGIRQNVGMKDFVQTDKAGLPKTVNVRGFVKNPQVLESGYRPEAELGQVKVERGIRVLTNDPRNPTKVKPTHEVYNLEFATHKVKTTVNRVKHDFNLGGLSDKLAFNREEIAAYFERVTRGKKRTQEAKLGDTTQVASYNSLFKSAVDGFPSDAVPVLPQTVKVFGATYKTKDYSPVGIVNDPPVGGGFISLKDTLTALNRYYADYLYRGVLTLLSADLAKVTRLKKEGEKDSSKLKEAVKAARELSNKLQTINKAMRENLGLAASKASTPVVRSSTIATTLEKSMESPVFPVSDENGYEVLGLYRYGRGLNIEPNGVFQQLVKQDPTTLVDRKDIEELLDQLTGKKSVPVKVEKTLVNGRVVYKRVGSANITDPNEKVNAAKKRFLEKLKQTLQNNYTDDDLIELGFATRNGNNPTQLDFQLQNFFATLEDGVSKVPVVNNAFRLADLHTHLRPNQSKCSCRMQDADLLALAVNANFIPVDRPDSDLNQVMQGYQEELRRTGIEHQRRQQQLQGTQEEVRENLADTVNRVVRGEDV